MESDAPTVAVIGLGALGLAAVKNLVEEGFNVTGLERNSYVGGLWHYTDEDKTSVLPSTIINISKERGSFTDFPFSDQTPSHATAMQVQEYLESYVEHFGLTSRLRLSTPVTKVRRDTRTDRWAIDIDGSATEYFDKVIIAAGSHSRPHVPELEGSEIFDGQILHSRAFKRPELFKGKKVIVVGLGNTGADTAAALQGEADKIYLSHKHGAIVLPRVSNGIPFDHTMTQRKMAMAGFLEIHMPWLFELMFNKALAKLQNQSFNIRPEWRFSPAPSIKHSVPVISDNLVDLLASGAIESVGGVARVSGPKEVELDDGTRLEADAIIWCTGYKTDYSLLDASVDPTRNTTAEWAAAVGSRGKPLPRLYRNIFSLDYPISLAFMGAVAFSSGAFPVYDLASMAVAQIWKGNSPLPSPEEMERAVDRQHAIVCGTAKQGRATAGWVRQGEWMAWANAAAGTGVNEYLGWGLKGWQFWLQDRAFYNMLKDGILTPFMWRVFDGRRKKWDGARAEIEKANRLMEEWRRSKKND